MIIIMTYYLLVTVVFASGAVRTIGYLSCQKKKIKNLCGQSIKASKYQKHLTSLIINCYLQIYSGIESHLHQLIQFSIFQMELKVLK